MGPSMSATPPALVPGSMCREHRSAALINVPLCSVYLEQDITMVPSVPGVVGDMKIK